MRSALAAVVTVLSVVPAVVAAECRIELGPEDRASSGETLVIRSGERVDQAIAVRGDLVVEEGAVVQKAVAIGGSVRVRPGATVREDAVAIGGDVRVDARGRVGHDAVSLGGQVRQDSGARIEGDVVGLAVQAGGTSLARKILGGVADAETCVIVKKGTTGG